MYKLIIIFVIGCAHAVSDEEVKAEFMKIIMKCTTKHPVEMNDLLALQKYVIPTEKKTQCLLACAYKELTVMNAKGEFDLQANYEIAQATKGDDPKALANGRKLAEICVKVNEASVKDGAKGCERATLIFKCVVENAPKLGFKI